MKLIPLTHGAFAKIDDSDFELVSQNKWHLHIHKRDNRFYARAYKNGKKILLHRMLMSIIDPKIFIDHTDGDGLNCQRDNMRIANKYQNGANRNKKCISSSKYMGVSFLRGKWQVNMGQGGQMHYGGLHDTEVAAALKYNELAIKYHGEFAKLNVIK